MPPVFMILCTVSSMTRVLSELISGCTTEQPCSFSSWSRRTGSSLFARRESCSPKFQPHWYPLCTASINNCLSCSISCFSGLDSAASGRWLCTTPLTTCTLNSGPGYWTNMKSQPFQLVPVVNILCITLSYYVHYPLGYGRFARFCR